MKRNNVKNTDTDGMHPKEIKQQRETGSAYRLPLLIADTAFLLALFRKYKVPPPPGHLPEMWLTDLQVRSYSPFLQQQLRPWLLTGAIAHLETSEEMFANALQKSDSPGIRMTELLALFIAQTRGVYVVGISPLLQNEAASLKVPFVHGTALLTRLNGDRTAFPQTDLTRVKKNEIFLSGVPAPIAGNNSKM
jgi:hypothetical protein